MHMNLNSESLEEGNRFRGIQVQDLVNFCIFALFLLIIIMVLGTMSENPKSLR